MIGIAPGTLIGKILFQWWFSPGEQFSSRFDYYFVHIVLQANDEMKPHPVSTTTADSDPSKDPSGPVWTAYADSYFEGEFTAPFSDQEEERDEGEGGDTSSSGSSETASLEDDPSVTEDKQPSIETSVQSGGCADDNGGQLSQGQQHLSSKPVESESPLSASSIGSPEHGSSGGSPQERLVGQ